MFIKDKEQTILGDPGADSRGERHKTGKICASKICAGAKVNKTDGRAPGRLPLMD